MNLYDHITICQEDIKYWLSYSRLRYTHRHSLYSFNNNNLKGILSTSCVIFSYPKLLSISVLTFIKWRLTPCYAAKDTIFWQNRPKTIVIRIIVWMTIFKSIHMAFYVNTSWACALFRNNKQHVVLGQKWNCQCVEESGLWRIQRERWTEVKYLPNGTNAGYM